MIGWIKRGDIRRYTANKLETLRCSGFGGTTKGVKGSIVTLSVEISLVRGEIPSRLLVWRIYIWADRSIQNKLSRSKVLEGIAPQFKLFSCWLLRGESPDDRTVLPSGWRMTDLE